jgi:hypothetical protein
MVFFITTDVRTSDPKFEAVPSLNYALHHEGIWESGGIAPLALNAGTGWSE